MTDNTCINCGRDVDDKTKDELIFCILRLQGLGLDVEAKMTRLGIPTEFEVTE